MQNTVETCSFVVQHLLSSAKHDEWRQEGISSFNSWVHYRRPRDIFGLLKWPDDTWCFCSSLLTSQVLAGKPNQRWCCQRCSGETKDGDLWSLENIRWLTNTRLRAYYLPWCLQALTRKMQKHNKTIITLNSQLNHTKTYSILSYKEHISSHSINNILAFVFAFFHDRYPKETLSRQETPPGSKENVTTWATGLCARKQICFPVWKRSL